MLRDVYSKLHGGGTCGEGTDPLLMEITSGDIRVEMHQLMELVEDLVGVS